MNTAATLERLNTLKLHGMERSLQSLLDTRLLSGLEGPELLSQLVDAEWDERREKRSARLIRAAHFRTATSLAELDFSGNRTLNRSAIAPYTDCRWVAAAEVFIITGATGIGKSFLAQALGLQACLMGHATRYFNARKLFPTLRRLRAEGSYKRFIDRLARTPVLILDDFGLEILEPEDRLALFEIIEDRAGKAATIITSQVPISLWFERIGEPTVADAICDRLVHRAVRFDLKGESRRKLLPAGPSPIQSPMEALEAKLPPQ